MIPREQIEAILARATQAPSGDNAQPWRFEVKGDVVDLFNIPGRDYSPYNYEEWGSIFAHGALIENIVVVASSVGYRASVELFPGGDPNRIARVSLLAEHAEGDPLAAFILERSTNRKPYRVTPLKEHDEEALIGAANSFDFGELRMISNAKEISVLAKTLSVSDRLIFEQRKIHDAIFSSIRWSEREEKKHHGLYVKTLELPPPAQVLFRTLKNWNVLTMLNTVKISHLVATQSAKNYRSSSAFGAIIIPSSAPKDLVAGGRAFERLWLTAASRNVALQPTAALPYLAARVKAGATEGISMTHQKEILRAYEHIEELFGKPKGFFAMIFRVGYGPAPTARSRKEPPMIHYID